MFKNLFLFLFMFFFSSILLSSPTMASEQSDKEAILNQVDVYLDSVKHADDTSIAAKVWLQTEEASFINPAGEVYGWSNIRDGFFRKGMAESFSKRNLSLISEPRIDFFGDMAVVIFFWQFDATKSLDGEEISSHGRESQVFTRTPDGWKIVHVHYSSIPEPKE